MRAITIKAVLILLTFAFSVNAQDIVSNVSKKGTTAAPFLSIAQGTRATGMGNAYVGVADDPSALFWNPAGLTKVAGTAVTFERTNWIADINYNFFAASYNLGDYGALGVSFISSEMDEMKVRTIDEPEGTGETFKANDVVISLGYAISLTENFSIGFNPKFIQQSIWKMSASAFAIDMGVTYVTPFDGIVLAMSISNFGTKMKLDGTSSLVLYDPDQNSSGNNGNIPSYLQTDEWELPLNFRVGLAYDVIKSDMHRLLVAVDAMHPSDDFESVNIGGEYTFNDMFSLRGGMKSIFLEDSEESFAVGVGIKQMLLGNLTFKIDYSYSDFGRLKDVQKFSVTVMF
ncbi:MAG: PorV/PorQ family protein [Melioribacteraceae bacterium]|nr:PorV/PorQ family protein [Melioribacteraceae bacterium]